MYKVQGNTKKGTFETTLVANIERINTLVNDDIMQIWF